MARTYAVTGSGSGIGEATAALLLHRGHRVIGVDVRAADVVADLSTEEGRADAVEGVLDEAGGRLDGIVANAGVSGPDPMTVAVNFFGAVRFLDGLRPVLVRSPSPRAAVTSSTATLLPVDADLVQACLDDDESLALRLAADLVAEGLGALVHPSSKRALSRWVRREAPTPRWAGLRIPLNAVAPGVVRTPLVADLLTTDEGQSRLATTVPMPLGGHVEPSEVAALLAWLVSEENTHVCGQTLYVDGGADAVLRGDDVWSWNDPAPVPDDARLVGPAG